MRDDGGSAFPAQPTQYFEGGISMQPNLGMTLRDYFAAAALQGLLASETVHDTITLDTYANDAYRFADVMLAERGK